MKIYTPLKVILIVILIVIFILILLPVLFFLSLGNYESKSGYKYENGAWHFVMYSEAGRHVKPLKIIGKLRKLNLPGHFAADDINVFHRGIKLQGSDPDTFQLIPSTGRNKYAKDKNNVYIYSVDGGYSRVYKADPDSFEVLEWPYSKDKNDAYNVMLPLFVDDVTKFTVVEGGRSSSSMALSTFWEDKYYRSEYNIKVYGFFADDDEITHVSYSDNGVAKTDFLLYEGYQLVDDKR